MPTRHAGHVRGWFKVYRDIDQHWLYLKKPFCAAFAFIDLLSRATHRESKVPFDSSVLCLRRGQILTSQTKLAATWGWSRDKVQRFLATLEKDQMIRLQTDNRKTIITICNYGKYQDPAEQVSTDVSTTDGQALDNLPTTGPQLAGTFKNENNLKNGKNAQEGPMVAKSSSEDSAMRMPPSLDMSKVCYAPRIYLTRDEYQDLIDRLCDGEEQQLATFISEASDWLLAKGQTRKDHAAFLRNWIRRGHAMSRQTHRTNGVRVTRADD